MVSPFVSDLDGFGISKGATMSLLKLTLVAVVDHVHARVDRLYLTFA